MPDLEKHSWSNPTKGFDGSIRRLVSGTRRPTANVQISFSRGAIQPPRRINVDPITRGANENATYGEGAVQKSVVTNKFREIHRLHCVNETGMAGDICNYFTLWCSSIALNKCLVMRMHVNGHRLV